MSKLKIAFAGFRHGHIIALYNQVIEHPGLEICAVCEEDPAQSILQQFPDIKLTHTDFDRMLAEVDCDIVAIGDYYAKRGSFAIRALQAGRHVIADKPLCINMAELDRIGELAEQKSLKVGCMFELRGADSFASAKKLIADGVIGEVTQIMFTAQHPLLRGSRPGWYFEDGKHGGTILDIACHGIDAIFWMTSLGIKDIPAARCWQAFEKQSQFKDAAQFMLTLDNGCGVMADVSYAAPDTLGYTHDCYWRFNIWGINGMLEFSVGEKTVKAYINGCSEVSLIEPSAVPPQNYLADFLDDVAGHPTESGTAAVLKCMRAVIGIQEKADKN